MYHKVLRVAAVVCALTLLFESGLLHESTKIMSKNTHQYLANSVGVGASINPTELNTVTAELTAAKMELQREREINVGITERGNNDRMIYILSGILFVLLVLIILNYTLDYLRYREQKMLRTNEAV
jgi:hypothetical protein